MGNFTIRRRDTGTYLVESLGQMRWYESSNYATHYRSRQAAKAAFKRHWPTTTAWAKRQFEIIETTPA